MARHEETHVTYTCDVCGEQSQPIESIAIPFAYYADLVHTIQINISAYIPYVISTGDVCRECFIKYMKKWLEKEG